MSITKLKIPQPLLATRSGKPVKTNGPDFCGNIRPCSLLCDPGMNQRQPFSSVASSSAIQKPTNRIGSVKRNVESWWGVTESSNRQCDVLIFQLRSAYYSMISQNV